MAKILWTQSMDQLLYSFASDPDKSRRHLAEILNISQGAIRNREKILGLKWEQNILTGHKNAMWGKLRPDFKDNHWTKTMPHIQNGKDNHRFKGGTLISNGYRLILIAPNIYKPEHIIVVEKLLGRPLADGEVVHHKDRNRLNNNPNNLMLMENQSEHMKQHWREGNFRGKRTNHI